MAVIEDGVYDRVSGTYAALFGYGDPTALEGQSWPEPFLPAERERVESEIRPAIDDRRSWHGEVEAPRGDGSTTGVTLSLEPFGDGGAVAAVHLSGTDAALPETTGEAREEDDPTDGSATVATVHENGTSVRTRSGDRGGSDGPDVETNGDRAKSGAGAETDDGDGTDLGSDDEDAEPGTTRSGRSHDRAFVRNVLDALDDVFYVVDEDGRFVLWNEQLVETTGYEPEALEPMDPAVFFADEGPDPLPDNWAAMPDLEDRRVELDVVTSDGEAVPHEFHAASFEIDGRGYRAGVVRDVSDRRRREEALRNSEERYRRLVEHAPVPIAVVADGDVVYCNEAAVQFLEADDPGEILGRSALEFVHQDDRDLAAERLDRVFEDGEVAEPVEERFLTLDGETRTAEVATAPINYEGAPAAQVVFNDVTEYKETQRRLEASRERYRRLIEAAPVPIWVQGLEEIRFCNEAAADFFGAEDREAVVNRSDLGFVVPEERERSRERNRHILEDGEVIEGMEGSKVGLDGKTRHGLFAGAPIRFDGEDAILVIARDITERKERERELERNETIIETVGDGVYALNEDLEFTFVNDALCDMFGRSRAELLGTDVRNFLVDADPQRAAADLRDRVVSGDPDTSKFEATVETPDGERIELEANYRLLGDPADGEFPGSAGVVRDVTERNRREREIARQRDELERITHINDLVLDVIRSLVETPPGEGFEAAICDQLTRSDSYRFAWIGGRTVNEMSVRPRACGGIDKSAVIDRLDANDDPLASLVEDTLRTGAVRTDRDDEDGVVATIPITHGDAIDDVLCLGADRSAEFGDREREGLAVLGETIGFVRHALETRKLLVADAVVELEFRLRDPSSPLVAAATETDGTVSLDGYVETDASTWLLYLSVRDASARAVVEALEGVESVASARTLADDGTGGHVEARVTGASLPRTLLACGGTVRGGTATGDEARFVVEVPAGTDVRRVVGRVTDAYPDATLLAQREREGTIRPPGRIRQLLEDELTDRQRSALRTAYHAGYFEWPRESTAEEVAG
ncbi:MAG: PAS domain S-box-containing protein, partial [Halobacteriales archaeon]